jgi:hypothetical protein
MIGTRQLRGLVVTRDFSGFDPDSGPVSIYGLRRCALIYVL